MKILGFDIGGTKCALSRWELDDDGNGKLLSKETLPTRFDITPYKMLDLLLDFVKGEYDAVGISCGGPLNESMGVIQSPPNLPGWDNVEIVKYLSEKVGCPAYLQNDANACALAEYHFGAGKGSRNMAFLTFGTGLGAGLILDGRLYSGTNGNAGELGHIRLDSYGPVGYGKAGSFEGFCSGGGLAQLGKMYATQALQMGKNVSYCKSKDELDSITAKSIAQYAKQGYEDAQKVYDVCAQKLGHGLAILIDILNPERIVIGSIFTRCEDLLRPKMDEVLKSECLSAALDVVEIVPAKLGESIGDYATLACAVNGLKTQKGE